MRLAFLGTPDFAVPSLKALIEAGHEIACVYSQPPRPRGRGQALQPSPVHAFADAQGLTVRTPASMKDPAEVEAFRMLGLEAAVVVAFGQILTRAVLSAPAYGCYNLHASLLPRWRGAAPIQRAIMAGDHMTGVNIMRMTEGLDEGPVVLSETTRIDALDTAQTLHNRLAEIGARLLVETIAQLAQLKAEPQPHLGATYAAKIDKSEARIDWAKPAELIEREVRAFAPFPGSWFELDGERIKVLRARTIGVNGAEGTVLDNQFTIACGQAAIRPLLVQRAGKPAMPAADFLRGKPVPQGTVLR